MYDECVGILKAGSRTPSEMFDSMASDNLFTVRILRLVIASLHFQGIRYMGEPLAVGLGALPLVGWIGTGMVEMGTAAVGVGSALICGSVTIVLAYGTEKIQSY